MTPLLSQPTSHGSGILGNPSYQPRYQHCHHFHPFPGHMMMDGELGNPLLPKKAQGHE